jgi:hypothetical protein
VFRHAHDAFLSIFVASQPPAVPLECKPHANSAQGEGIGPRPGLVLLMLGRRMSPAMEICWTAIRNPGCPFPVTGIEATARCQRSSRFHEPSIAVLPCIGPPYPLRPDESPEFQVLRAGDPRESEARGALSRNRSRRLCASSGHDEGGRGRGPRARRVDAEPVLPRRRSQGRDLSLGTIVDTRSSSTRSGRI